MLLRADPDPAQVDRKNKRGFGTTVREVGGRTVPRSATAEPILHQTVADLSLLAESACSASNRLTD